MGKLVDNDVGNVLLLRKDELLGGLVHSSDHFFSIIPSGDEQALLLEHDPATYPLNGCAVDSVHSSSTNSFTGNLCLDPPSSCSAVIDVAVLLTDPALDFLRNLPGANRQPLIRVFYLLLGMETANMALVNSGVDNVRFRFKFKRYFFGFFTGNLDIEFDVDNISADAGANDLRNQLAGDVVIALTNQNYGNTLGIVDAIGPNEADAYGIVEIPYMFGPGWIFAHELGHLLGARHDRGSFASNDNTDICSHGWQFDGGDLGLKRTILAITEDLPLAGPNPFEFVPGGRLLHYSNPDINVDGSPSGTSDDNNAITIANAGCTVAAFRPDPTFRIQLLLPEEVCMQGDIIQASVLIYEPNPLYPGQPPYSISWNVSASTDARIWLPVQASFPQTMTITVTVISADGQVRTESGIVDIINCQGFRQPPTASDDGPLKHTYSNYRSESQAKLYPNPALDVLHVRPIFSTGVAQAQVQLLDLHGRIIKEITLPVAGGFELDLAGLPANMYFLRIISGNELITYPFHKQ